MASDKPKIFSNKVIQLLIQHNGLGDMPVTAKDYMVIRVAFRNIGGSWEGFSSGDQKHIILLKLAVQKWCQIAQKRPSNEMV